jgi:hypothetical protein
VPQLLLSLLLPGNCVPPPALQPGSPPTIRLTSESALVTVRVRATAHYGGAIGDVRGEMRRTYYVHSDPDLAKGFPLTLGLGPLDTELLLLSLFLAVLSLRTGRTTALNGVVHLTIFAVYLFTVINP